MMFLNHVAFNVIKNTGWVFTTLLVLGFHPGPTLFV